MIMFLQNVSGGIDAGLAWKQVAQGSVVYVDFGITRGMQYGIDAARNAGLNVEYRYIYEQGPLTHRKVFA